MLSNQTIHRIFKKIILKYLTLPLIEIRKSYYTTTGVIFTIVIKSLKFTCVILLAVSDTIKNNIYFFKTKITFSDNFSKICDFSRVLF